MIETKGTVLRIERSSIHDGPGIRTVVFLKGCPLSCAWCSTPESQLELPEVGYKFGKCSLCGVCVSACEIGALSIGDTIIRDRNFCINCLKCADVCTQKAMITYGYTMTVSTLVKELTKDEVFFFHSGGGVTISGGEPLTQADFTAEVLKACKKRGINTAVETSLSVPFDQMAGVLNVTDYLYVDIKHMDREKHRQYTGLPNELILKNLINVDRDFKGTIVVRLPLIPGINDDEYNLCQTARFCRDMGKRPVLELLPYHRLGIGTYEVLGVEYGLKEVKSYDRVKAAELVKIIEAKVPGQVVRLSL